MDDRHQSIRDRAYQIWEEEGRPEGNHEDHWRRAEGEYGELHDAAAEDVTEEWKVEAGETENDRAPTWPTTIAPD